MAQVHVRLDLEHKTGERRFDRHHNARSAIARLRRWRPFGQRSEDFAYAEVVDCRAEEHRRLPAGQKQFEIERMARVAQQLDVVAQRSDLVGKQCVEPWIVETFDQLGVVGHARFARCETQQAVMQQIEDAAKALAHAERPRDRRAIDFQHRFDFLDQREPVAHFAVHLVDKRDDRRRTKPAHFEQLDRLRLDALGCVDHHHRRVDGGQHAIGVLREVLMPRRIEQIDRMTGVFELHDRARHRDAALLFHFHPVGCRVSRALARLDRTRELNGAAEQQQLFGQRRLACVRMGNDRERTSLRDVAQEVGGKRFLSHR